MIIDRDEGRCVVDVRHSGDHVWSLLGRGGVEPGTSRHDTPNRGSRDGRRSQCGRRRWGCDQGSPWRCGNRRRSAGAWSTTATTGHHRDDYVGSLLERGGGVEAGTSRDGSPNWGVVTIGVCVAGGDGVANEGATGAAVIGGGVQGIGPWANLSGPWTACGEGGRTGGVVAVWCATVGTVVVVGCPDPIGDRLLLLGQRLRRVDDNGERCSVSTTDILTISKDR